MNAFQLFDAAFDSACDYAEPTAAYVQQYAEGAFEISVHSRLAQKIADCKIALDEANEDGNWSLNLDTIARLPLEAIELDAETETYAAHDGDVIHGTGATPQAALDAACESVRYTQSDEEIAALRESLRTARMTPALAAEVREHGGDRAFATIEDGRIASYNELDNVE